MSIAFFTVAETSCFNQYHGLVSTLQVWLLFRYLLKSINTFCQSIESVLNISNKSDLYLLISDFGISLSHFPGHNKILLYYLHCCLLLGGVQGHSGVWAPGIISCWCIVSVSMVYVWVCVNVSCEREWEWKTVRVRVSGWVGVFVWECSGSGSG